MNKDEKEFTSSVTSISVEDSEDITEGLKALADKEGTVTWNKFQIIYAERRR